VSRYKRSKTTRIHTHALRAPVMCVEHMSTNSATANRSARSPIGGCVCVGLEDRESEFVHTHTHTNTHKHTNDTHKHTKHLSVAVNEKWVILWLYRVVVVNSNTKIFMSD